MGRSLEGQHTLFYFRPNLRRSRGTGNALKQNTVADPGFDPRGGGAWTLSTGGGGGRENH